MPSHPNSSKIPPADRSIAQLDLALRRRFTFVEMPPNPDLITEAPPNVPLKEIFIQLNRRIVALRDRDHQLGHSYFMNLKSLEDLHFAFTYKILPLLQEYFYNDNTRLRQLLGDAFFKKRDTIPTLSDEDEPSFDLKPLSLESLSDALLALLIL